MLTVPGDIAEPGVGARVVEAALARFGRVDTVVNNAGVFIAKPFTDYTDEDYDAVTGVNLRGFFEVTRSAVAAMLARGRRRSRGEHLHQPRRPRQLPSALGAGVVDQGRTERGHQVAGDRIRRRGIRVNTVALGIIRTPMHPESTHDALAALHPIGRMGEIDDVVDAVVYLENAPFVTGEILHVDGGQSAGH